MRVAARRTAVGRRATLGTDTAISAGAARQAVVTAGGAESVAVVGTAAARE